MVGLAVEKNHTPALKKENMGFKGLGKENRHST